MGEVVFYDPSILQPPPQRLSGVDTTSPRGRLLAEWTNKNRRSIDEYDRRRRAREGAPWHEEDPAARTSRPRSDTASITTKTVSTDSGAEVLTVTASRD